MQIISLLLVVCIHSCYTGGMYALSQRDGEQATATYVISYVCTYLHA